MTNEDRLLLGRVKFALGTPIDGAPLKDLFSDAEFEHILILLREIAER